MAVKARDRARNVKNALVNQPLRQLEQVRRAIARGEVDVLVLGDSGNLTAARGDVDRSMIQDRLARRLNGARVATVAGPGFSAGVHEPLLRILADLDQRPRAVVMSVAIRPQLMRHVREHPIYSYEKTRSVLARVRPGRSIPWLGAGSYKSESDYDAFFALPMTTLWTGPSTIGSFRSQVAGQGPHPWPVDKQRVLFDYFHGELIPDDHVGFADLTAMGRRLRDYGVPAFVYWTMPSLAYGERLFPGEFADKVTNDWRRCRAAAAAENPDLAFIEADLAEEEFEDAQNGTEHFNEHGREKIAGLLADAITARVGLGS